MPTPMDPTSTGFLFAENRNQPMHVGGLQLFRKPEGAGRNFVKDLFEEMLTYDQPAPLFLKRPHPLADHGRPVVLDRGPAVRHRVPLPAQRAPEARPDPRAARAVRPAAQHPAGPRAAAVGGAPDRGAARRAGRDVHQDAPRARRRGLLDAAAAAGALAGPRRARHGADVVGRALPRPVHGAARAAAGGGSVLDIPGTALKTALGISAEAAGLPGALLKTLSHGVRNQTSAVSLYAPRTILNKKITGARRFAAEDWPMERIKAVGKATGTTVNDVVLAMCSGAMRTYLDRARRAPRRVAGGDGAGRAAGQELAERLGVRRQRGRRGDGEARHRARRPGRPADVGARLDGDRQAGARHDDPRADPGDERAGHGPRGARADAAAAGRSPGRRST